MTRVLYVGSCFCPCRGVAAELPRHFANAGVDVDVIVPHLAGIDEGEGRLAERLVELKTTVDGENHEMRLLEGRGEGHIRTFYIDDPCLNVSRLSLNDDDGIKGIAVFAHAVVEWLMRAPIRYDLVHCEGLETALIAVLMRTVYTSDKLAGIKIVSSLAGKDDKGTIDMQWLGRLGLPDHLASSESMEFYGKLSLLKGAYLFADGLIFPNDGVRKLVENNRGNDIGMEGVLFSRTEKLFEVGFGIDTKSFDPETDKIIEANYSAADLGKKAQCKAALIQKLHLKKNRPVIVFMGCLNADSGIELVNDILDDIMDRNVNLVIAGQGSDVYMDTIKSWKDEFKGSIAFLPGRPDDVLRRRLISGADILLLPAKIETFGRSHLIAMRYGTAVVAREQGCPAHDLHNVRNIDRIGASDNGFSFQHYDSDEFFNAVMDALDLYGSPAFGEICAHAAAQTVSLDQTARDCAAVYAALLK